MAAGIKIRVAADAKSTGPASKAVVRQERAFALL
jgi:hypothetical protein